MSICFANIMADSVEPGGRDRDFVRRADNSRYCILKNLLEEFSSAFMTFSRLRNESPSAVMDDSRRGVFVLLAVSGVEPTAARVAVFAWCRVVAGCATPDDVLGVA